MTPLYKSLKSSGTSFYAFPSAAEKLSASHQNANNKMYFSNYVLLNFPKKNLTVGTNSAPIYWDFDNSTGNNYGFQQSINAVGNNATNFGDQVIESLRNYVANFEETMRISKLNNNDYFYDNNSLSTPAEKIFFKWCKQLNLIDFEPANNGDQYIGSLSDFASRNINDVTYFNEIVWTERNINEYDIYDMYEYDTGTYTGKLIIVFQTTTNFKVGDIVLISDETNAGALSFNGKRAKILEIIPPTALLGQSIIIDLDGDSLASDPNNYFGNVSLVYHKLVQYIGEVNGVNNVQSSNLSYNEIYAQVSGYNGATPDILFRTSFDDNYAPNLVFPILPSQYQPEIVGAEFFTSPIVTNPQDYPGSYYGQFDTSDFTYTTNSGDSLRRSGDYFGVSGDINTPVIDSSNLDGISIDFNPNHYSKMNLYGREVTNFEQFNALVINGEAPSDFDFNAILWYYIYEDINGNAVQDLYGVQFLDNPDNDPVETGNRFPLYSKKVATDEKDGTAYDFSLDLHMHIINENPQDAYNPNAINSLYSFNLYNEAMRRLASLNQSFSDIITENQAIKVKLSDLTQQIYTQANITSINQELQQIRDLLQLYQTNQLVSSSTIEVSSSLSGTVPLIELNSIDARYFDIENVLTSNMYDVNGVIPYTYNLPNNKDSLIVITNNDQTSQVLEDNNNLTLILNRDLDYKQTIEILINADTISSQNKKLDVFINYGVNNETPILTSLISNIDLPVYYNTSKKSTNSAYNWSKFNFDIDINSPMRLNIGSILEVPINSNYNLVYNSFQKGDTIKIEDFTIGTFSVIDFSGQYPISSVGASNSYIYLDISDNSDLVSYGASSSLPLIFNDDISYLLNNNPKLGLNKGIKYSITRVDETDSSTLEDRYLITSELL